MASGDASRHCFPEMISMLKTEWNPSMSWEEIISFRDRLNKTLQEIRTTRNIRSPMIWCPKCQARHRSAPPKISVRALILALGRFQVVDEAQVKKIEKEWKKYRKDHKLDLYGKADGSSSRMADSELKK